ncbi:hypothetical protein GCM10010471_12830 [Leucobacter komagatae]
MYRRLRTPCLAAGTRIASACSPTKDDSSANSATAPAAAALQIAACLTPPDVSRAQAVGDDNDFSHLVDKHDCG